MKRTLSIITLSFALAVAAFAQTPPKPADKPADKPAEAMPNADQIVDKYIQAVGGKAAIEKITSRVEKGSFEIPAMGASGSLEAYQKAPNKSVFIVTIPGFGVVSEGFDGTLAWASDPQSGLREKSGVELADAKLDAVFHRDLRLKELFPKMTVVGKQKVGEREAFVIEATPKEGSPEKWYFDAQSWLLIRMDQERETPQGKIPAETYLENYKEVDGIKRPFTIRVTNPAFTFEIRVEEVKHNVAIDDAKFSKPSGQ